MVEWKKGLKVLVETPVNLLPKHSKKNLEIWKEEFTPQIITHKKMSHFSTIKTKLKNRKALLHALMLMGHGVDVNQTLENPAGHEHEQVDVQISIGKDIGFRWNETTSSYELVTDLQTWNEPIPVKRFLDKVSQCYAVECINQTSQEEGFEVLSQEVKNDGSVEMVLTKWS